MGGPCSTNGEKMNAYRLLVGKPEGKRLSLDCTALNLRKQNSDNTSHLFVFHDLLNGFTAAWEISVCGW
jgi:hypothetical protein